jgi:NitT/TauT family transport system permease protein
VLLCWQYVPEIPGLRNISPLFDQTFVSSPSKIALEIYHMAVHSQYIPFVWPYMWRTLFASIVGTAIGVIGGVFVGLVLASSDFAAQVIRPFIVAMNAVPRIALIPVLIIIFGGTIATSIASSVLIVFFIAFFNAFEGARNVGADVINNARLMGASPMKLLIHVRLPYSLAWTYAALPLALTFSLISVVTNEILTGYAGMGQLIEIALTNVDASLTFAVVVYLATVGLVIVLLVDSTKRRVLHWMPGTGKEVGGE